MSKTRFEFADLRLFRNANIFCTTSSKEYEGFVVCTNKQNSILDNSELPVNFFNSNIIANTQRSGENVPTHSSTLYCSTLNDLKKHSSMSAIDCAFKNIFPKGVKVSTGPRSSCVYPALFFTLP